MGKTWGALDFAACYYIDTEGGANLPQYTAKLEASGGVYLGPEHGALSFDIVLEEIRSLATQKHPYRTLVIDSVSKLFSTAIAQEAERLADADKKNEYGADKKPAVSSMRRMVSWLTRLDMTVILIAHQKDEYGLSAKGDREVIGQTFDAWDRLEYELHLALQIVLQGNSRFAKVRKSRLENFKKGDQFPWSFEKFSELYGRDAIEAEVTQIVLASPEQLAEVRKLLEVVRVPDDQESKWFTAANVVSWTEMDADKVDKIIAYLKAMLPTT